MSRVNLELQMKFLSQLEEALEEALVRYADAAEEKVEELDYMKQEVMRARRIVGDRMSEGLPKKRTVAGRRERHYERSDALAVGQASF